jgi:hypothetical protein
MYLPEKFKVVPVASYKAVAFDTDSINMKNYHKCTFLVQIHDLAVADLHVLVYSGATDGSKDSALTFKYCVGTAAQGSASCDVMQAWSTSADLTLAHGTYDDYLLIIEVDTSIMDIVNQEKWLTLSTTTTTGHATVIAILEPRYTKGESPTALA